MPTNLRQLGVYGQSLPTKKSKTVRAADFNIGGIVGLFGRRYKAPLVCQNISQFQEKFGSHEISSWYGWDGVKGFFDNVADVSAELYVVGHVGYDGAAFDGVAATATLIDALGADTLKIDSAYEEELDYSAWGNRTGYTITNGVRFATAVLTATTKDDLFIYVDSVAGMVVGDMVKVVAVGGGGATVYKEITAIDESAGKVSFLAAFDGAANPEVDDVVTIPGFRLRTYRKSINGVETEVDEQLGKVWCTMQDSVSDFFVENVFSSSKFLLATDLDVVSALGSQFPADVTTVAYLATGANGTAPTSVAHWSQSLLAFNDMPIRFLANPETTTVDVQKAIETYSRSRTSGDYPKVIYNVAENQTKSQYITIGNNYQRSDDVAGVINADWLKITDPFSTSTIAPDRHIPNVGHIMGAWIRSIEKLGIHFIPAVREMPIFGVNDIVRTTVWSDVDRTDLAESGINIIDFINGAGLLIRNFFTPSTTQEFQFANGILMRDFIKVSSVGSLQTSENTPNSFTRIKEDKMAVLNFYLNLWQRGSTGTVTEGETFGQSINTDGSKTTWEDHIEVQADLINNPQSGINAGERNVDSWFSYPAPTGSIRIGVGLLLRS
jgi:hypothetical protein